MMSSTSSGKNQKRSVEVWPFAIFPTATRTISVALRPPTALGFTEGDLMGLPQRVKDALSAAQSPVFDLDAKGKVQARASEEPSRSRPAIVRANTFSIMDPPLVWGVLSGVDVAFTCFRRKIDGSEVGSSQEVARDSFGRPVEGIFGFIALGEVAVAVPRTLRACQDQYSSAVLRAWMLPGAPDMEAIYATPVMVKALDYQPSDQSKSPPFDVLREADRHASEIHPSATPTASGGNTRGSCLGALTLGVLSRTASRFRVRP